MKYEDQLKIVEKLFWHEGREGTEEYKTAIILIKKLPQPLGRKLLKEAFEDASVEQAWQAVKEGYREDSSESEINKTINKNDNRLGVLWKTFKRKFWGAQVRN